jgi:hypothetical protein
MHEVESGTTSYRLSAAFNSRDTSAGGISLALTNSTSHPTVDDQMALPSGQAEMISHSPPSN